MSVAAGAALSLSVGAHHVSAAPKKPSQTRPVNRVRPAQTVWPLPPETPRIRYIATYHGVQDFEPVKKPSRFLKALLGDSDAGGQSADSMMKPYGVAVSPDGMVYVSDTAARRVFAFDLDARTVKFVGEEGTARLTKPIGVAVGSDGNVCVADGTLKRVFCYAPDGSLVVSLGGDGELVSPSGLAIDSARKVLYVVDAGKHQILCYSLVKGELSHVIGRRGSEPGEFNFPTNAFVDGTGFVYVADTLNFRIQIFDGQGQFVRTFGTIGDSPGFLNRPKGVAVDSEGHVYVTDSSFNNFQIFDSEGKLLLDVGHGGQAEGEFWLPAGLYIDKRDHVYVADQGNARLQVFEYLGAGTRPSEPANPSRP